MASMKTLACLALLVLVGCGSAAAAPVAPAATDAPTPIPAPTSTAASLVPGNLSHSSAARVGGPITLKLPIRNAGTSTAGVQLLVRGLDDQTFVRCNPACYEVDTFGTTVLEFSALAPGKSGTYSVIYQAVKPGKQSVSVALDVDLNMIFGDNPTWYADFPVLI